MTRIPRLSFVRLFSLLPLAVVLLAAAPSMAASFQTGEYGGKLKMTYYVPDGLPEKAPLVLALHFCSGNETSGQSWFKSYADQYKFVIISPKSPGNCWDSAPGRSGDRAEIAKMIDWAITTHKVDPARVYSAGASSGACMSQTMLASYPDKIAAASALAGVPVGFWMGGNECGVCSQQVATGDGKTWGDKVRAAGPAMFMGSRGRVQLFHAKQDQYLGSGNLAVEVSQWSDALGVMGMGTEEKDKPRSGWTRTTYKNAEGSVVVQSNWWANSPANSHDLTSNITPALWNEVVAFFGLDQAGATPVASATGTVAAPPAPTGAGMTAPTSTPVVNTATGMGAPTAPPPATSTPVTGTTPTAAAAATSAPGGAIAPPPVTPSTGVTPPAASVPPTSNTSAAPAGTNKADQNLAVDSPEGGCQVLGAPSPGGGVALTAFGLALAAFSRRRRAA